MKGLFQIFLFIFLFQQSSSAQQTTKQESACDFLIGKTCSQANQHFMQKRVSYSYITNMDERIIFMIFISSGKQYNIWAMDSTIIHVSAGDDNSLYGDTGAEFHNCSDSVKWNKFIEYWRREYKVEPDFKSTTYGIVNLREGFGQACGAAGEPIGAGKLIRKNGEEVIYNDTAMLNLLLSFDPNKRVAGYYYLKKNGIEKFSKIASFIEMSPHKYNWCSGCTFRGEKTAKEIVESP